MWCSCCHGLVSDLDPRPHPLMMRNGLVNKVEFLGLVHAFVDSVTFNVQNILWTIRSKRYGCSNGDEQNFTVVREVLRNNY